MDVASRREAFDYGFGLCRDNSLEGLADVYATDADSARITEAVATDFPVDTRSAVIDGCAAGFAEQARLGGPREGIERARLMTIRDEHERGLAAFLRPERRERFRASLASPRLRRKLQDRLHHFEDQIDPRRARPLAPHTKHAAHVDHVIARLEAAGAPPTCFVLAYGNRDGLELPLRPAVATLMAGGAGMLSCVPGRLALYVGEDGSTVLLLTHHAQADRA